MARVRDLMEAQFRGRSRPRRQAGGGPADLVAWPHRGRGSVQIARKTGCGRYGDHAQRASLRLVEGRERIWRCPPDLALGKRVAATLLPRARAIAVVLQTNVVSPGHERRGRAQKDLARRCSSAVRRGPGSIDSSWALGSPYLHPWPFGTNWRCCVSLSYPSLDGENCPADPPYGRLPDLYPVPMLETNQCAPSGPQCRRQQPPPRPLQSNRSIRKIGTHFGDQIVKLEFEEREPYGKKGVWCSGAAHRTGDHQGRVWPARACTLRRQERPHRGSSKTWSHIRGCPDHRS